MSQVTAAGLTAPSHDSAVIRHRRASAQVLHFALSLLHACAARAPPGSDDARVPVRVHCRAALLSCLSDHFASTAIPDHSSLERYSALIRSLYTALLADLEEAQSSSDAVKDDLLGSVRSLVRVDHRPVVAAAEGEPTNALLNSLIENLDRSGCIAGGRSLLATLIKLHHDLRLMPALIQALFTGAAKAGDGGRLSCLMLEPGLQASLKQVTEGMSGVQLALCWIATKESFFAADRSPLLLLQAWSQPLAWAYVSSGNSLLSDVPLKSALLPLLKDMQSKLEKVQISHPSKGKSKSGKRKVLDVDSVPDGNRDAALRIAEILAELCAVHSAQAPTLARLPDPSDESDLEQWAAVYRSAGDMLRLLAVDTLSVGQASCALQLFTLLVTIDAVRDVSLELSSDGSSIDPDASLSAMLCGLASAKEMSADMSLMLLGRLAVWSHLLRCSTHGPNHEVSPIPIFLYTNYLN